MFIGAIRKTRWPAQALNSCNIFYFTSERNLTTLDRKQYMYINVLYHVCVFSGRSEKQDGGLCLWLAVTFSTSPQTLFAIQPNLIESKILMSSTKFVFFGLIGKSRRPPRSLIGWDFWPQFWNRRTDFNNNCQEASSQHSLPSFFLWSIKKQYGRPGL